MLPLRRALLAPALGLLGACAGGDAPAGDAATRDPGAPGEVGGTAEGGTIDDGAAEEASRPGDPTAPDGDDRAAAAARGSTAGMVRVPGGTVRLGAGDERRPDRGAVEVELEPFWLDAHEVTNDEFAHFVAATGHVTDAERIGDSVVFRLGTDGRPGAWALVEGASWRAPQGPGSDLEGLGRHPVVHVSIRDARAYAAWAGKRLAGEAEWEHAARGGLVDAPFAWGATPPDAHEVPVANTWQGTFPLSGGALDGYATTAPVGSYPPNGYGLFDVSGNVWEWVDTELGAGPLAERHPPGPPEPRAVHQIRGGSFLCAANYCQGYRVTERQFKVPEDASSNLGFRCARDVD